VQKNKILVYYRNDTNKGLKFICETIKARIYPL
jgi:hypothetical protein